MPRHGKRFDTSSPEYRLEIPHSVMLTCPQCKAEIRCDVYLDMDAGFTPYTQAVAMAWIDTDECDTCGKLLCPRCPREKIDDLDYCLPCAAELKREKNVASQK